jgi:hypothetical protein
MELSASLSFMLVLTHGERGGEERGEGIGIFQESAFERSTSSSLGLSFLICKMGKVGCASSDKELFSVLPFK